MKLVRIKDRCIKRDYLTTEAYNAHIKPDEIVAEPSYDLMIENMLYMLMFPDEYPAATNGIINYAGCVKLIFDNGDVFWEEAKNIEYKR